MSFVLLHVSRFVPVHVVSIPVLALSATLYLSILAVGSRGYTVVLRRYILPSCIRLAARGHRYRRLEISFSKGGKWKMFMSGYIAFAA